MAHKKSILIVDDAKINRALLRKMLSSRYQILEAENGQQALEQLMMPGNEIDAIVLDLIMPVMDGYAFLRAVRGNARLCAMPILVTTQTNDEESEIHALECGATDFIAKPYKPAIVMQRIANLLVLSEAAALRNTTERDATTGSYNRQTFFRKVAETLALRPEEQWDILCLDIEHFKIVNDLFGTAQGDHLLHFLADMIQMHAGQDALCGRLNADNFAMLIPHCEGAIEEFAKLLQQELDAYPLSMNLLLAFGVYPVDGVCAPVDVMCDRANIAIRKVKGNYNQHIAYYDAEMRSALMAEQTVLNEMEWALETQQFILYFQPKYDLPTGAIIGAEALVRWQHPQKGLILPGAFIPVFENNGFITRLDGYVWERTCQVLQGWLAAGAHPLPVSVNISRVNFYDPTLCDRLVALVKQYELTPNLLELELTESAYTENPQQLIAVTKELQRNGFVILMDDFGSGYSSLNMLKDVPVDILKIDLGFLECNANAGRGCNILSSVVRMAKWLDIPVIAEGVETCEQVNFLRGIGCNSAQGYYYSKPVPQDVYEALLAKQDSTVPEFPSVSPVCENFDLSELLNPHSTINLLFNSFSDSVGIYEFYGEKLEALRVNEGYFKMVGQPREKFSIADHNVLSILENEDRDIALCALKKAARTGSSECELRHPIGTQMMWIRARARRLADRGERQFFYIVFDDITMERKKARSLQELLDHVPAGLGVYEVGDTLRTRYISKGMHQLNGMPENEASPIVGGELSGVRAQQTEQLRRECIAAFNEGRMVDIRYPFVSADGHQHWAWAKGKMLKNDEGELLCYALVSDITTQQALEQRALEGERKLNRVFEESRMNEERYRIVQSLTGSFLWEYDLKTKVAVQKTDLLRRYGISERVIVDMPNRVVSSGMIAEQDDCTSYLEMHRQLMAGQPKVEWVGKTRLLSGELRWLRIAYQSICGADGLPTIALGVCEDVTEKKAMEARSTQLQQQKIPLSMDDVIATMIINLTQKTVLESEMFVNGVSMEPQVAGCKMRDILQYDVFETESDKARLNAFINYESILSDWAQGHCSRELEYRCHVPGGELAWVKLTLRVREDERGDLIGYGVMRNIDRAKKLEISLQYRAERDSLTNLYNRTRMVELIEGALKEKKLLHAAFMVLDIDDFKIANDTYGHVYGDELLVRIAKILEGGCRKADVVGRLGGDEFVIFLRQVESLDVAQQKADRIMETIHALDTGTRPPVNGSIGIAMTPAQGTTFAELYQNADNALYEAKRIKQHPYGVCADQETGRSKKQ